ncbi:hypothetical protein ADL27_47315, partial [Streptomyces sp. NRRL F-6602]
LPVLDGGHALGRGEGTVAYWCAVGHGCEDVLRHLVRRVAEQGCATRPGLLKRFGEGSPGWLSFPARGWGLSLELPARATGLTALLDELEAVLGAPPRPRRKREADPLDHLTGLQELMP